MADVSIIGTDGKPLRNAAGRAGLARPFAVPALTGVRQIWGVGSIADGLTPQALASVLRQADDGDGRAYLRLALEMEQREAHYRSVLGTRKRAVTRLPITVESASDDNADVMLADEIRALVRAPGFRGMLAHALDGLGKGYAAIEMRWDTARTPWVPRDRTDPATGETIRGYEWIDPRWFRYDRINGRTLRLLDDTAPEEGLPLPAYRYIIHEPELMSGIPLGRGLARVACVSYMAKSYTLKDWLAFAEVYGMPLRVGKYGPGASDEDIAILAGAVGNLGTDAAAVMPDAMKIEFVEAAKSSSGDVFSGLAEWADKQISKAVLGQTASADGTPGALGNQDSQEEVREDLRDADAEELADTLNRDLVGAYLALNHGAIDAEDAPTIVLRAKEPEDIKALSDALAVFIPLGLRVAASEIRDKLGLMDPADGEPDAEILGAAPTPAPAEPEPPQAAAEPPPATNRTALNRQMPETPDTTDNQVERLGRAADPLILAMLGHVRRELDAAPTLEIFRERVAKLYPELQSTDLATLLGRAFVAAELAGYYEAQS